MAQSSRHRARELVLQALYALETSSESKEQIAENVIVDADLPKEALEFGRFLFAKVIDGSEWADGEIVKLAHNWKLDRIALIDRTILRMAMIELKVMVDVPVKVVINEALELAKAYSTGESSRFINGVLDTFVKNSTYQS